MSLPRTLMSALQIDSEEAFAGADLLCHCDTVVPVEFGYHIGLLEREGLRVISADGARASWAFDPGTNSLGASRDGLEEDSVRRVMNAFAPYYQWFYSQGADAEQAPVAQFAQEIQDEQTIN